MNKNINVYSEIEKLKKVILHRPGHELTNLAPDQLGELLFDEIPFLDAAIEEHDYFAQILRDNGCEVYYLEDLAAESLTDSGIKEAFINEFLEESDIQVDKEKEILKELFQDMDNKELVLKMMGGIRKSDLPEYKKTSLPEIIEKDEFFVTKPMPNLYFTRDPFSLIGHSVSLNHMWSETRRRETLFGKYIFKYHNDFKIKDEDLHYNRELPPSIEGGDILVLSDELIAVGTSERTSARAIEQFAKRVLREETGFKKILVLSIPKKRAFMHLDTVFTMVDRDLFTVHPEIEDSLTCFGITFDGKNLHTVEESSDIEEVLLKNLHLDKVDLIRQGSGGLLDASREQWSDGYNTLAIAPREVVVYDRNVVTNQILRDHGVTLHIMKSGELSRGRGGPRCMSMPIYRERA